MNKNSDNFRASYADLSDAWHAIADEFGTDNMSESTDYERQRVDVVFVRLLKISGWTVSEWNAERAAEG